MVLRVAGKEIRRSPAACSRARVNQVSLVVEFSFTAVEFGRSDECGAGYFLCTFLCGVPRQG